MQLISSGFSSERIGRAVFPTLQRTELCSMATLAAADEVHINTAFFAFDEELYLYFLSDPSSRHCIHVERAPTMAITVFDSRQPWGESGSGVQLFGAARPVSPIALAKAEAVYAKHFPRYPEFKAARATLPQFQRLRLYEFETAGLTVLDEAEFGDAVLVEATVVRPALEA